MQFKTQYTVFVCEVGVFLKTKSGFLCTYCTPSLYYRAVYAHSVQPSSGQLCYLVFDIGLHVLFRPMWRIVHAHCTHNSRLNSTILIFHIVYWSTPCWDSSSHVVVLCWIEDKCVWKSVRSATRNFSSLNVCYSHSMDCFTMQAYSL